MILIADSSALVALAIVDKLDVLEILFGSVYIPTAVFNEISKKDKPQSKKLTDYCKNRTIDVAPQANFNISLGLGESEAILLYKEKNADFLLCDDKKAKEKKLINTISPLLTLLKESNIFIDDKTFELVLKMAGE